MARKPVTLPDKIADTHFCKDRDDFYKLVLAQIRAAADDPEEAAFLTTGIRLICHEYLALVLSKKLEPYDVPEEWVKREQSGFRATMDYINEFLAKTGIPLREGENGKVNIDYERLDKLKGELDGEA